ncbi:hypothetical protein [Streptomyces sp. CA2R101]|uniref:hypothetical protein n=1 Tax=Streptomyces sp. CA2R101 TaxID=3120152 RepID=UPI00300B3E55
MSEGSGIPADSDAPGRGEPAAGSAAPGDGDVSAGSDASGADDASAQLLPSDEAEATEEADEPSGPEAS